MRPREGTGLCPRCLLQILPKPLPGPRGMHGLGHLPATFPETGRHPRLQSGGNAAFRGTRLTWEIFLCTARVNPCSCRDLRMAASICDIGTLIRESLKQLPLRHVPCSSFEEQRLEISPHARSPPTPLFTITLRCG